MKTGQRDEDGKKARAFIPPDLSTFLLFFKTIKSRAQSFSPLSSSSKRVFSAKKNEKGEERGRDKTRNFFRSLSIARDDDDARKQQRQRRPKLCAASAVSSAAEPAATGEQRRQHCLRTTHDVRGRGCCCCCCCYCCC